MAHFRAMTQWGSCRLVASVLWIVSLPCIADDAPYAYFGAEMAQIHRTGGGTIDSRLDDEWKPAFQLGGRFGSHYSAQLQLGRASEENDNGLTLTETLFQGRKHWPGLAFAAIEPYLGVGLAQADFDPDNSPGSPEKASLWLGELGLQHFLGKDLLVDGGVRFLQDMDDQHRHQEWYLALNYRLPLPEKRPIQTTTPAATTVPVLQPEPDSDRDGIDDDRDRCPQTPQGARVTAQGCAVILTETVNLTLDIEFAFNSAVVSRVYDADLDQLASTMVEYPGSQLLLEGYTDSVGGAEFNRKLSERRAFAVKKILVNLYHIDSSRITSFGKGESDPVASNDTEAGRAMNRRVEAVIAASRQSIKRLDFPTEKERPSP